MRIKTTHFQEFLSIRSGLSSFEQDLLFAYLRHANTSAHTHMQTFPAFRPIVFLCVSLLFSFVIHPNQSRAHFPKEQVVVSILAHWGSTLVPFHWDTLQPLHYPDRPLILNSTRLLSPCLCDLRCTGIHL